MTIVICLVIALVVAILVYSSFTKQLKSAQEKTEANFYMEPGSLRLTEQEDRFTNTTRTVVKASQENGPVGGVGGRGGGPVPGHGGPGGFGGPGGHGPVPGFGGPAGGRGPGGFGGPGGPGGHGRR